MKSDCKAVSQLRLDALTLRGIGPYFHEARLEIKPITVIAGENGSGKSTWFKVLQLLKNGANSPDFPLSIPCHLFPIVSGTPTIINDIAMSLSPVSTYHEEFESERKVRHLAQAYLARFDPVEAYGPLGSVGIEATAQKSFRLLGDTSLASAGRMSGPSQGGAFGVEAGDKIKMSISFESQFEWSQEGKTDIVSSIMLQKNDEVILALGSTHSVLHNELHLQNTSEPESANRGVAIIDVGLIQLRGYRKKAGETGDAATNLSVLSELDVAAKLFRRWVLLLTSAATILFSSRTTLDESFLTAKNIDSVLGVALKKGHVGERGENTLQLERALSNNILLQGLDASTSMCDWILPNKVLDEYRSFISEFEEKCSRSFSDDIVTVLTSDDGIDSISEHHGGFASIIMEDLYRNSPKVIDGWGCYQFGIYFIYWMEVLLAGRVSSVKSHFTRPPCGFLANRKEPDFAFADAVIGEHAARFNIDRHRHGALLRPSPASSQSSGFHHIAPIVVQTGVMWSRESLLVESPEAHLHPSMQIRLTEFFLLHAKTGRQFILETHSDLIVRRLIRAILEEEISQEEVGIYFTRIDSVSAHPMAKDMEGGDGLCSSYLERIRVNEKGQIANWPPGFMDADIVESRRMMDAIYGDIDAEAGEDVE